METNGSGVSALLGLDGFVVRAQLLDEGTGEWWLAVETDERGWCPSSGYAPSATAAGGSRCETCLSLTGRWCWCGPSGSGAAGNRPVRWAAGRRSPTRSPLGRCSPSGREPRSPTGSGSVSSPWPGQRRASGWAGTRQVAAVQELHVEMGVDTVRLDVDVDRTVRPLCRRADARQGLVALSETITLRIRHGPARSATVAGIRSAFDGFMAERRDVGHLLYVAGRRRGASG
jgi:hypothetical protein